MQSPIELPQPTADGSGEPQLLVGGLWGSTHPTGADRALPWVEWSAEHDTENGSPSVVLGRD